MDDMTMPHLMNCSHSSDSWCLNCVKDLHESRQSDSARKVDEVWDEVLRLLKERVRKRRELVAKFDADYKLLAKIRDEEVESVIEQLEQRRRKSEGGGK
jgi:hypothetical protein